MRTPQDHWSLQVLQWQPEDPPVMLSFRDAHCNPREHHQADWAARSELASLDRRLRNTFRAEHNHAIWKV